MPKRIRVTSPNVPEPPPQRWSNCLRVGDTVFVSGMVARGADGKIEGADEYEQARVIFAKIRHLVEAAGGKVDDVVKVTIFVVDIRNNTCTGRAYLKPVQTVTAGIPFGRPYNAPFAVR